MLKCMTIRGMLLAAAIAIFISAHAIADTPRNVDIPAGDLRHALLQVSQQFGADLVYRPEQVDSFQTRGARGELTAEQAVTKLLEGTPLTLHTDKDSGSILIAPSAQAQEQSRTFDIPAQPLSSALIEFSRQSDVLVVADPAVVNGRQAPAVQGSFTPSDALNRLLAGSGLAATQRPGGGYVLANSSSSGQLGASGLEEVVVTGTNIRGQAPVGSQVITIGRDEIERAGVGTAQEVLAQLPQNFRGGVSEDTRVGAEGSTNAAFSSAPNLRGLGVGSTLVLLNGRRLAAGGATGLFSDISSIPATAIERIDVLTDGASAIYGSDAVGGVINVILRRDYEGAETGVRYGQVTDGDLAETQVSQAFGRAWTSGRFLASYEYYNRGELRAEERNLTRTSDLTRLGGDNFAQSGGNPGNIITASNIYGIPEGQDGTALTPADLLPGQPNFASSNTGTFILPEQERQSVLASLTQEIAPTVELSADVLFSRREFYNESRLAPELLFVPDTNAFFVDPEGGNAFVEVEYDFLDDLGPRITRGDVETVSANFGARFDLADTWRLRLSGDYNREELAQQARGNFIDFIALDNALADANPATAFNPFGDGSNTNPATIESIRTFADFGSESELWSINATVDGELLRLPAGALSLAAGVDHRTESFLGNGADADGPFVTADFERDVTAVFAELLVPVFGPSNRAPGFERLEFSLADRVDNYSDFGSANTPKFGILWSPVIGLEFNGSWGQSFKAPSLSSRDTTNNRLVAINLPDPSTMSGVRPTLIRFGNNSELTEETAEIWTLGVNFEPTASDLQIGAHYFDITFEDRIIQPSFNFAVLTNPALADLVILNPTPDQIAAACADGTFGSAGACTAPVGAIADFRMRNASIVQMSGIDFDVRYSAPTLGGELGVALNATYIDDYTQALSTLLPEETLVDTVFNPIDLTARGDIWWERGEYRMDLFVNYADDYVDNISFPNRSISSWTTFDANLRYAANGNGFLPTGTTLSLNVRNLFDEDPPFVNNATGVGYDQQNADVLGRFVSFSVSKTW